MTTKANSLIFLVHSMSKSEKRIFRSGRKTADYVVLFDMICKEGIVSSQELKLGYEKRFGTTSFNVAVTYLYETLLDVLLALRKDQDSDYRLFNKILRARILFEKGMYDEALEALEKVKQEAERYENQIVLMYASRMELEYLLFLNMPDISEAELVKKHALINETLKKNRIIYEHSSLYELLMHRIIYKGNARSREEKEYMNDLVLAEMSLSTSSKNSLEAYKLHQMFQSRYLMSIGDSRSAFRSFRELNNHFENNPQFWTNPPFYYVSVLQGILDNLRSTRNYDKMPYFIERLRKIENDSARFKIHVATLVFLYELFILLDTGDFAAAKQHLDLHQNSILMKKEQMDLFRRAEISLYTTLTYIGLGNWKQARKALNYEIIDDKKIFTFSTYRIIRLVSLIIFYELHETEYLHTKIRLMKRQVLKVRKMYRIELLLLDFLSNDKWQLASSDKRRKMQEKLKSELEDIRNDVFESQLLRYFDFTAWIESKIDKTPLAKILSARYAPRSAGEGAQHSKRGGGRVRRRLTTRYAGSPPPAKHNPTGECNRRASGRTKKIRGRAGGRSGGAGQ